MKKILVIITTLSFFFFGFSERFVTLNKLVNPHRVYMTKDYINVVGETIIYISGSKDLKSQKKSTKYKRRK